MVAQKSGVSDWVKWASGILITLVVAVNGWVVAYTLGNEHRVTKVEADFASHLEKSKEDKTAIVARLDRSDENWGKVLTGISSVQVDVAEIKGYMQRQKTKD
jgi:fumarylacetoacetate (FAA) hydrolase family protein